MSGPSLVNAAASRLVSGFCPWPLEQPRDGDSGLGRPRQRSRIDQREYALARKNEVRRGSGEAMRYSGNHSRQPE